MKTIIQPSCSPKSIQKSMKSNLVLAGAILLFIISCKEKVTKIYNPPPDSVLMDALNHETHCFLLSETEQLNLNLQVLDIATDSLVSLGKLSENNKSLFFFFSRFQCGECVERELKYIKELYPENTVIILAKEENKRNLLILQRTRRIHQKMYLMKVDDSFKISMEELNRPLFFRINTLGRPYNLYSPKFSYPQFSEQYHKTIVKLVSPE